MASLKDYTNAQAQSVLICSADAFCERARRFPEHGGHFGDGQRRSEGPGDGAALGPGQHRQARRKSRRSYHLRHGRGRRLRHLPRPITPLQR